MADQQRRPGALEFRSFSGESVQSTRSAATMPFPDLPSPRAGEIPPALSPLDALAMQGRLLAKRFEQENKNGRRMSRLAPLTIQNEFGNRSGYFSSLTSSAVASPEEDILPISPGLPQVSPRAVGSADRHKSFYPQFDEPESQPEPPLPARNPLRTIGEGSAVPSSLKAGYFDIPRSQSPDAAASTRRPGPNNGNISRSDTSRTYPPPPGATKKQQSYDSLRTGQQQQNGLLPPKSSSLRDRSRDRSPKPSPSVRSVPGDSSDEVEAMSLSGSYDSLQARNMSTSSIFRSHSPYTPLSNPSAPRSPSLSSDMSNAPLPRPAFNFSRPMSSAGRPSLDARRTDLPMRQASDESALTRPSFDSIPPRQDSIETPDTNYGGEVVHTPISMTSEDFRRSGDFNKEPVPAPSYTYTKFNLPRGRKLDRQSIGIEDFLNQQITWDDGAKNDTARPMSPQSPPRTSEKEVEQMSPRRKISTERSPPSVTSSDKTIRAKPEETKEISAQEHCDKGLELHEAGELMKSTYHLRLAARAGLPEAMFWYGLACRHGWGMRVNQAEALQWLRKAVDSGQLEVAEDEDHTKHGQPADNVKRKKHRAQYAVAIYELGKCYMNGWGASVDKPLALRCYEIAGNWGDADALVEAGYCYAEGVGCKKDMKKAARFYRAAEAKGVSMVGNSWQGATCI